MRYSNWVIVKINDRGTNVTIMIRLENACNFSLIKYFTIQVNFNTILFYTELNGIELIEIGQTFTMYI